MYTSCPVEVRYVGRSCTKPSLSRYVAVLPLVSTFEAVYVPSDACWWVIWGKDELTVVHGF